MIKKTGKLKCAACEIEVVIGYQGLAFCPNNSCKNSEASYLTLINHGFIVNHKMITN